MKKPEAMALAPSLFAMTLAAMMSAPALAQEAAPPEEALVSPVSPTVQEVRRHMLDTEVNSFYFRHLDDLFFTRKVPRSGPVWSLARSEAAVDLTFQWGGASYGLDEFLERTHTNAFLILKGGRIVHESYRNLSNDRSTFASWSMAKSITSTLVGLAVEDGDIASLDDPVTRYLPELEGGGYDGVSVRQVLEMTSGVDYEERYDFENPGIAAWNHENALVRNAVRFADVARTIARAHPPGEVFAYKTIDTAVLGWLLERVTGRPVAFYMADKLWEPLGAEADGFFILDGEPETGREFTGAGYNAVARDYARFGQMILDNGFGNGRQIIPANWIVEATQPASEEGPEGGYGFQWWTVGNSGAFYALGLQGQFIYIDPETQTVIVKLSYFPPDAEAVYPETLAGLAAIANWVP